MIFPTNEILGGKSAELDGENAILPHTGLVYRKVEEDDIMDITLDEADRDQTADDTVVGTLNVPYAENSGVPEDPFASMPKLSRDGDGHLTASPHSPSADGVDFDAPVTASDIVGFSVAEDAAEPDGETGEAEDPEEVRSRISSLLSQMSSGNIGEMLRAADEQEKRDAQAAEPIPPDPFAYMDEEDDKEGQPRKSTGNEPSSDEIPPDPFAGIDMSRNTASHAGASGSNQQPLPSALSPIVLEALANNLPVPTEKQANCRLMAINTLAVHYYLASDGNWLFAFMKALDELPAACLGYNQSPVEHHSLAEADEAAEMLGYSDYAALARDVEQLTSASSAIARFGEETAEWAREYWFADRDFATVTPVEYARAVVNEIRSNWPIAKVNASAFMPIIGNGDRTITTDAGETRTLVGVSATGELWDPTSMATKPREDFEAQLAFEGGSDPTDANAPLDDELVSLAYLQCYQSNNRSWNKASEALPRYLDSICTFCWASIASEFRLPSPDEVASRVARLDELADELRDENGNIALRQIVHANGTTGFDAPSQEFHELYLAQKKSESQQVVALIVESLLPAISKPEGSPTSLLAEDVMAVVFERAGGMDEKAQLAALDEVREELLKMSSQGQRAYKSQWKKYLSAHKDAAANIKDMMSIIGFDEDGDIVFDDDPAHYPDSTIATEAPQEA